VHRIASSISGVRAVQASAVRLRALRRANGQRTVFALVVERRAVLGRAMTAGPDSHAGNPLLDQLPL